jgi:Na+-transporting NADH:ubiquinone oxidoreductase subunit NqrC
MKALSIKQPWAYLIVHAGKDIENRKWNTKHRGKFLIHASKQVDKAAIAKYRHLLPKELDVGGIVGEAEIVDVVQHSPSKWFEGPYGFVLENAQPRTFRPMKGQLNFFEVSE